MRIRDAEALYGAVEGKHVCEMPVVEPESGGGDEDRPVGGMLRRGWEGGEERDKGQGEGEQGVEAHCYGL